MGTTSSHNRTIYLQQLRRRIVKYIKQHLTQIGVYGVGGLLLVTGLIQAMVYADRLPVFAAVDGVSIGNYRTAELKTLLQQKYTHATVAVYAKDSKERLLQFTPHKLGLSAKVDAQVDSLVMPVWLRILPAAPLWGHMVIRPVSPEFAVNQKALVAYVDTAFGGKACRIAPRNANLRVVNGKIEVVKSGLGGECRHDQLMASLQAITPSLAGDYAITLPVRPIEPAVTNQQAESLRKTIQQRLAQDVVLQRDDKKVPVTAKQLTQWLRFTAPDKEIVTALDAAASEPFLRDKAAPLVTKAPGTTRIETKDFVELSRSEGAPGVGLNYDATRQSIARYLVAKENRAMLVTQPVAPKREYTRSYSNTDEGLSALIKQYAEDKKGSFGISLIELDGKRRRASYNGDSQFTSASTYKVFVAMSVLRRVEAGKMSWGEPVVDGRNLEKCFDDMIVLSDNSCPMTLAKKIGPSVLHREARELGLQHTSFIDPESFKMTANDLATFAAMLESRQLPISQEGHGKLIAAMKRNIHRKGIPAGSGGTVADKVGFIDNFLHDMGIVYGTNGGTYALAILTKDSSWADIAELTKRIEQLRAQ